MNEVDRHLLDLLQRDSTLSYAELGRRVGLSTSAVNERLKKLERAGAIRSWSVVVDPRAADVSLCVFMLVLLEANDDEFVARMKQLPEVQECHHITGEFSYILKIRVRGAPELEEFLMRKLKPIRGFTRTHTLVVLSSIKEETCLDLGISKKARKGRKLQ